MTNFFDRVKSFFTFNEKTNEDMNKKLMDNVEVINKKEERTFFQGLGFVEKVDLTNLTPIERSRTENVKAITLNDGSVKTIDEMFNKLIKPSQMNYIGDPNSMNEARFVKLGDVNVEINLKKDGLNTIIDGATKYVDTMNHDRMVSSINTMYKNYVEYNDIIPRSNLLSINKLNNEIGLMEDKESEIILNLNKAYNDYYKKEDVVNKSLLKIENLLIKNIEKPGNEEQDIKLVEDLNKIKHLKDKIFDSRETLNSPSSVLSKEDKKHLTQEINSYRGEVAMLLKSMPADIKKELGNYDANVSMLEQSLKKLEIAEMKSINHNDLLNSKIEKIKRLNNSIDTDDYTKSGILPDHRNEEQIKKLQTSYDTEYKKDVETRANQVTVKTPNNIPGLSDGQYLEYKKAIGFFESRHRIGEVNSIGFMGRYQMGVEALQSAGFIKAGSVEKFLEKNNGKPYDGWQNEFLQTQQSSWDLKKCPGGQKGFLASAELQDIAMDKFTAANYNTLTQRLAAQGKDIKDITPSELPGVLASAHLVGVGGTSISIRSQIPQRDGNKTDNTSYMNVISGIVADKSPDLARASEEQVKNKLRDNGMIIKASGLDGADKVALGEIMTIEDKFRSNTQVASISNEHLEKAKNNDHLVRA